MNRRTRRKPAAMRQRVSPLAVHPYAGDGIRDHRGADRCRQPCGLPRTHAVHQLPPTDPDVVHAEQRRIGETGPDP